MVKVSQGYIALVFIIAAGLAWYLYDRIKGP